jgi:hypothetical protein
MAEPGTIENDNPVILGNKIDQTAGFKILDHASVAVQKDYGIACATFHIVQSDAVHF